MTQSKKTKAQLEAHIKALERELGRERAGAGAIPVEDGELQKAVSFGSFAHDLIKGMDLKPIAAKVVLGFMWGYTVMSVSGSISSAIALLAIPAWSIFVLTVLMAIVGVYVALATVVPVTNFTYNSAADLIGWLRKEYVVAKGWAADAMHDYKAEAAIKAAKRDLEIAPSPAH